MYTQYVSNLLTRLLVFLKWMNRVYIDIYIKGKYSIV